ncbi:sulfotransferase 1A1-like [Alosa alosa]|uniref:sulfotransferase 1A1-like n=1 Tax=Alosa alosa TaxID=278164 RepID=UPI002015248F|nr:sulfotransferase 1A1-like [Alosa alosa]
MEACYSQMEQKVEKANARGGEEDASQRLPLIKVRTHARGVPIVEHFAKNLTSVSTFRPDPSDLLICTYPKSDYTKQMEAVDISYSVTSKGPSPSCSSLLSLSSTLL